MSGTTRNIPDCLAQKLIIQSDINKKNKKRLHPFCCFLMVLVKAISKQADSTTCIYDREKTQWQLMHGYRKDIDGLNKQLEVLTSTENPDLTTFYKMKVLENEVQSKMAHEDKLGADVRSTGGVQLSQNGSQLQSMMDLGGANVRAMSGLINYVLQQIK